MQSVLDLIYSKNLKTSLKSEKRYPRKMATARSESVTTIEIPGNLPKQEWVFRNTTQRH